MAVRRFYEGDIVKPVSEIYDSRKEFMTVVLLVNRDHNRPENDEYGVQHIGWSRGHNLDGLLNDENAQSGWWYRGGELILATPSLNRLECNEPHVYESDDDNYEDDDEEYTEDEECNCEDCRRAREEQDYDDDDN